MIARLSGTLIEKQAPYLLLDVQGVGYEVLAPMTTCFVLPKIGDELVLQIHFAVSETSQTLYGFVNKKDREMFRLLIKVNGVGPKMALALMAMDTDDIVRCVLEDELSTLVKVPGVGKKTAERLLVEMRDKLKSWSYQHSAHDPELPELARTANNGRAVAEAESALVALGYKPVETSKAIAKFKLEPGASAETLIRLALKSMFPG